MKKVTEKFPNLFMLWAFAQSLHSNPIEIKTLDPTLICDCKDEHIENAIANYKARLVMIHNDVSLCNKHLNF